MTYHHIHQGVFLHRPNRFVAEIELSGKIAKAHVKNTGRLRELLVPGATVYVNQSHNPLRTTQYDLITVVKGNQLVNIDSLAPNRVFGEYLQSGGFMPDITLIKPEAKYKQSRFDFYVETANSKAFIEVKGVTLELDGAAQFPDAPTERGVKHLNELAQCITDGYEAYVVFIIQMQGVTYFTPNNLTHPAFGAALKKAVAAGVQATAFDCNVTADTMTINNPVQIVL